MASLPAANPPTAAHVEPRPHLPSRPHPAASSTVTAPDAARRFSPESSMEPSRSADDVEPEGEGDDAGESSESEWEYEYSTTETETYYLTVDLSIPDFAQLKDDAIIHNTRGGYKSWFNPMLEKPDITGVFENDDDDDDTARRRGRKDQAGATIHGKGRPPAGDGGGDTARPGSKGKTWEDREEQQIQIMDLHTERPLVAHRGMVFTGTWSNNIGTELIFTEPLDKKQEDQDDDDEEDEAEMEDGGSRTPQNDSDSGRPGSSTTSGVAARRGTKGGASTSRPLPYITALPGATLLAASSARLQCRPTTLTARSAPRRRHEAHRAARAANGFAIQVTDDRTGQRRPQARFLERLAALKRARGEADEVTVATVENPDDLVEGDSDEDFEREKKARKRGYEDGRRLRRARLQRINDGLDPNPRRRRRRRPDDRRGRRGGEEDEDGAEGSVGDVGSYVGLDGRWWFGATNPDSLGPPPPGAAAGGDGQAAEGGEGSGPSSPRKRRRLKPLEADGQEEQGAKGSQQVA
ncbi:hypothetical protein RB600_006966 [Gaeumannomyces tritici]